MDLGRLDSCTSGVTNDASGAVVIILLCPTAQAFLFLSVSQAFLLNVCIFYCTTTNSPLATTVTGQLKDFIMTGLGMFLFGDVIFNTVNIVGLCVGLGGGLWYSYLGYRSAQGKSKASKDSSV